MLSLKITRNKARIWVKRSVCGFGFRFRRVHRRFSIWQPFAAWRELRSASCRRYICACRSPDRRRTNAVVGQICMKNASTRTERMEAIKGFVCKYGPMDIMTALTITAKFAEYNQVYLPKSKLLRKEVMDILLHMKHFFPFAAALCEAAAQHHTVSTCDSLSRFLS